MVGIIGLQVGIGLTNLQKSGEGQSKAFCLLLVNHPHYPRFLRPCLIHCSNPRPLGIHKSQLRLTLLSLSICRVFGFQNDSDIWLGECEWALVQEQRSMLTPINVPLNGKCVRRLITIVVEMVGDLEKEE